MSKPDIIVDGLSKRYRIGVREQRHTTFREAIVHTMQAPIRRFHKLREHTNGDDTIWALKDVGFEVQPGEVVGIIGRNGAGKTTLLKILSRITEPTEGVARLRGRVASLLEVGTGFHPELTGRENIYLNGAILGMKRAEINRKFDEIVAFSEIEKFLDTPVKRYSSGMYVRLAFAVAAHLEPEILIVDEVLAVGDAAFQKKCLNKMGSVAKQGRTVLLVSHNMSAIESLCERAVLVRQGQLAADGSVTDVVRQYLSYLTQSADMAFEDNPERSGSGDLSITGVRLLDEDDLPTREPTAGCPATIELSYVNHSNAAKATLLVTIFNSLGVAITHLNSDVTGDLLDNLTDGGIFRCEIPRLPLPIGEYRLAVAVYVRNVLADLVPNALAFQVPVSRFFATGKTPDIQYCACMVDHRWEDEAVN